MSNRYALVLLACLALACSVLVAQAPIDLKFPFANGETWVVTQGYDTGSHVTHPNSFDDKYAVDFSQNGCDAWRRPILAMHSGIVEILGDNPQVGWGHHVRVKVPSQENMTQLPCSSRYAHFDEVWVTSGEWVHQGQVIGLCGNSGFHYPTESCQAHPGTHVHVAYECDGVGIIPEPMSLVTGLTYLEDYESDNGGLVGYGEDATWHTDDSSEAFYQAYIRNAHANFGAPTSDSGNPNGVFVHKWDSMIQNLFIQNFDDADFEKRGAILWTQGSQNAYAIRGGFWELYRYNWGPDNYGEPLTDEGCWFNNGILSGVENIVFPAAQLFRRHDGSKGLMLWNPNWLAGDTVRFYQVDHTKDYLIGDCSTEYNQTVDQTIFLSGFSTDPQSVEIAISDESDLSYDYYELVRNGLPAGGGYSPSTIVITDTDVVEGGEYEYQLRASIGTHVVNLSNSVTVAVATDEDDDGVIDTADNCLTVSNANQNNSDSDSWGNACDNCPNVANQSQADTDGDGPGDACDPIVFVGSMTKNYGSIKWYSYANSNDDYFKLDYTYALGSGSNGINPKAESTTVTISATPGGVIYTETIPAGDSRWKLTSGTYTFTATNAHGIVKMYVKPGTKWFNVTAQSATIGTVAWESDLSKTISVTIQIGDDVFTYAGQMLIWPNSQQLVMILTY